MTTFIDFGVLEGGGIALQFRYPTTIPLKNRCHSDEGGISFVIIKI